MYTCCDLQVESDSRRSHGQQRHSSDTTEHIKVVQAY